MGELILCNQMMAAFPYYIDEASINIYSLEELSYYIENNLYLLEVDFMNEDLCTWVDKELKLRETAMQLREIYRKNGTLSEFVDCILSQSGYLNGEQKTAITAALKDMETKSEFERIKLRADRYVENHRYINAIYEYRKLLMIKEETNQVLVGNVWHNLGRAYTGVFLFQEAAMCFHRAYELNENRESLRECLYAYRFMQDERGFKEITTLFNVEESYSKEIGDTLTQVSRMDDICRFEAQMDELFAKEKDDEIGRIVTEWKDTYRKNCRI